MNVSQIRQRAQRLYRLRIQRNVSRFFSRLVDRLKPDVKSLLLATALAIGCVTGLAAVVFIELIEFVTRGSFEWLPGVVPDLGRAWLIVIPALGGLLAGPIIARFAREAKGHGVPEVMQALALRGGRIRGRVAIAKIVASSLCIGTGGSAGREGPIVQVGSTLGSVLGQVLRLSDERIRNLVCCGAAAGVAATFNAPIAGVAFAMEVLAGDLGLGILGNVVISAVTASVISQTLLGSHSAFEVPQYQLGGPLEIFLYIGLGLLTAVVGVAFIKVLYKSEDLFDNWKRFPDGLKPALGGLLLGVVAYLYGPLLARGGVSEGLSATAFPFMENGADLAIPHILGSGFKTIGQALSGPLPVVLLLSLVVLKIVATSLTLGSGNSGGVFAPSLFMGAMVGGAFGTVAHEAYPDVALYPGAYALCGMAGVFAASARAPLTAILIAFEMSDDYGLILPLMAATITATLAGAALHPESIYTAKLVRRGIRLRQGRDIDVLDGVMVSEIMDTQPATVPSSMSLKSLENYLTQTHHHGALAVGGTSELAGIVTLQDLERAKDDFEENWQEHTVGEIMIRTLLTAFPDETMGEALQRMAVRDIGRLPVVDRQDPRQIVGIIRRTDIARAYQRGLLRRADLQDRANQLRISHSSGTEFVELRVESGSAAAGQKVRNLGLPEKTLLTTRRRGHALQLLHGDDILQPGDLVLALSEPQSVEALRTVFTPESEDAARK